MASNFTFNTTQYQFSHGKSPRGNGNWMFTVKFSDGTAPIHTSVNGWYGDAKMEIVARFYGKAVSEIVVMP